MRRSAALSTLEELASQPVTGMEGVTAAGLALDQIVPIDGASLLLLNNDADAIGQTYDEMFDPGSAQRFFSKYYDSPEEAALWPSCRFLMNQSTAIYSSSDNTPGWRNSEIFSDVFAPNDIQHWVRVFLRRGSRPIGVLFLGRGADGEEFDANELAALRRHIPLLEQIAERVSAPGPGGPMLRDDSVTWIVTMEGAVEVASADATSMATMAYGLCTHLVDPDAVVGHWLRETFLELRRRVTGGRPSRMERSNIFGRFEFTAQHLYGVGNGVSDRLSVTLSRHVPVKNRLFLSPRFRALPRREKQAVLGIVDGLPNQELAVSLGVAPSTAVTWIRSLYSRFGVGGRADLIAALLSDAETGQTVLRA